MPAKMPNLKVVAISAFTVCCAGHIFTCRHFIYPAFWRDL